VISATDRSTLTGGFYAVLLLLARLGLRAGEIALLELDTSVGAAEKSSFEARGAC